MPISGKMYMWGERAKYVPEEAGVYAFYNEDSVLISVGGGANLRKTFANCLETDFSDDPRKRETRYYRREFTENWEERVKELMDEYGQEREKRLKPNISPGMPEKGVPHELGFHFYEDIGKQIFEAAFNLDDFWEKVRRVPVASLEFHQKRGDFARWVSEVFKETQLAERIENVYSTGEELRRGLLDALSNPEIAECPNCGTETNPTKKWKMAGRPSRTGERLQLTIAFYKCKSCKKVFRKVIKKEEIKP